MAADKSKNGLAPETVDKIYEASPETTMEEAVIRQESATAAQVLVLAGQLTGAEQKVRALAEKICAQALRTRNPKGTIDAWQAKLEQWIKDNKAEKPMLARGYEILLEELQRVEDQIDAYAVELEKDDGLTVDDSEIASVTTEAHPLNIDYGEKVIEVATAPEQAKIEAPKTPPKGGKKKPDDKS